MGNDLQLINNSFILSFLPLSQKKWVDSRPKKTFVINFNPSQKVTQKIKTQDICLKLNLSIRLRDFINRSDEGLTLETSAFELFTMVNLRFPLSC